MKRLLVLLLLILAAPASAADTRVNDMTANPGVAGTDLVYCPRSTTNDYKCTVTQVANYIFSLMSAQATCAAGGACTLAEPINAQSGTTYTVLSGDQGKLVTHNNGAAIAVTLPQCGSAGFAANWFYDTVDLGAGTATITPTTSTIDGGATLALTSNQGVRIVCDGSNYFSIRGKSAGGGSGTVTSITCPSGGTITTSGTCAVDVKTYCASGCDGTSGATWTRPSSVTLVHLFGCGGGGGGGGGSQGTSGTAMVGGGGGGGADCHEVWLKAADAGASQTITIGGGGAGGAGLTSGTTPTLGNVGVQGGNTTFGTSVCGFCTFFGGGGGQGGKTTASATNGGAGGSPWAAGATNSTTGSTGCTTNGSGIGNGGGSGGFGTDQTGLCGAGGGGSTTGALARSGGYASVAAPGGASAGGVTAAAVAQAGAAGAGSIGCGTAPAAGAVSATQGTANGGSTAADFVYHPGCGGGGGAGAIQTSVSGAGGAGTSGAGGGGGGAVCVTGGSCTAQASSAGGNGGGGFLLVESF